MRLLRHGRFDDVVRTLQSEDRARSTSSSTSSGTPCSSAAWSRSETSTGPARCCPRCAGRRPCSAATPRSLRPRRPAPGGGSPTAARPIRVRLSRHGYLGSVPQAGPAGAATGGRQGPGRPVGHPEGRRSGGCPQRHTGALQRGPERPGHQVDPSRAGDRRAETGVRRQGARLLGSRAHRHRGHHGARGVRQRGRPAEQRHRVGGRLPRRARALPRAAAARRARHRPDPRRPLVEPVAAGVRVDVRRSRRPRSPAHRQGAGGLLRRRGERRRRGGRLDGRRTAAHVARRRRLGGAPARRAARRRDADHAGVAAHDGLGHRAWRVVRRRADRAGRPAGAQGDLVAAQRRRARRRCRRSPARPARRPRPRRHSPSARPVRTTPGTTSTTTPPSPPNARPSRRRRRRADGRPLDGDGVRRRPGEELVDAAPRDAAAPRRRAVDQPRRGRGARPRPAGVAAAARRRHDARRDDDRSHRHALRARARPGREGRPGDVAAEGHRLRHGRGRRAHPRSDPGSLGDRRRGPQPHPPARRPRRPDGVARGERAHRPAGGRDRQGHRRQVGVPRPRHHAAPADRRRHRRRQVERHQLHPHVAADAHDARPGSPDPRRPQAGRDGPVQPPARTCSPSRSPTRRRRPTRWAGR